MRRINLYIDDSMFLQFKGLPGTLTEHAKIAFRDYLDKIYIVNSSSSKSKRKEDE